MSNVTPASTNNISESIKRGVHFTSNCLYIFLSENIKVILGNISTSFLVTYTCTCTALYTLWQKTDDFLKKLRRKKNLPRIRLDAKLLS